MSDRKFLSCPTCGSKKWMHKVDSYIYRCKTCEADLNLAVVKQKALRDRQRDRKAKGTTAPRQRRPTRKTRLLDPAYMHWVHGWPCLVPDCLHPWPVHAHHSVPRSRQGSDRTAIPLCAIHHTAYHSQIGSIPAADKLWMIDIERLVDDMNAKYEEGVRGPYHDHNVNYQHP